MKHFYLNAMTLLFAIPSIILVCLASYLMFVFNINPWAFVLVFVLYLLAFTLAYALGKARQEILKEEKENTVMHELNIVDKVNNSNDAEMHSMKEKLSNLEGLFFRKVVSKCPACGQWGAALCECKHCGHPIDMGEVPQGIQAPPVQQHLSGRTCMSTDINGQTAMIGNINGV